LHNNRCHRCCRDDEGENDSASRLVDLP
jgi:hypothetical protein